MIDRFIRAEKANPPSSCCAASSASRGPATTPGARGHRRPERSPMASSPERSATKPGQDQRHLSNVVYRHLVADARRAELAA